MPEQHNKGVFSQEGYDSTVNNGAMEELERLLASSSPQGADAADTVAPELVDAAIDRARELEDSRWAVGIELLPYRLVATLIDKKGRRLLDGHRRLKDMSVSHVVAASAALAKRLVKAAGLDYLPAGHVALGLVVGGPVDSEAGVVRFYCKSPPIDRREELGFTTWHNEPLGTPLQDQTDWPVAIANDASALAVYQRWFGLGRSRSTFALLVVREGVGGAYIEDGRLSRASVEVGQVNSKDLGRPCDCGREGCIEASAGTRGILSALYDVTAHLASGGLVGAVQLAEAADGDVREKVLAAFREAGTGLAHGVGLMINMFASPLVVYLPPILSEPDSNAATEYLARMRTFTDYTHQAYSGFEVLPQPLGPYDGAHGAALIALERRLGVHPEIATDDAEAGR
ncbi:ROK family protein [Sinosporangium siamense]|uniref:ROK family protein n=2 Tax=Sinosporangium siamense TaxID=1367973 RepID=A0A919RP29_9ACTN|nr:ROK family protein [Sinosporangium siamense]GII95559.1 hypothetical protein Ssi02_57900 [Sinosporangium siamense]